MNLMLCLLAGAAVGWIASSVLKLNAARSLVVCAVIGAIGAYFGGRILAPVFVSRAEDASGFDLTALLIASASAMVLIKIADIVYRRFEF
jgi:uncharacterized membrane protein YeaQ/YmgE (transglycosylase-associated protein family)